MCRFIDLSNSLAYAYAEGCVDLLWSLLTLDRKMRG